MDKSTIRSRLLQCRKAMSRDARLAANERILRRITRLEAWQHARSMLLYLPVNGEVDTWPFFEDCMRRHVQVFLPCCRKQEPGCMDFFQVRNKDQLVPGAYNIPEPDPDQCLLMREPSADIVLVPGVGFDRHGFRIGYGGGYYDRFFARHPMDKALIIGLAFACQIMDQLPHDPWDKPVDMVVTEDEGITE
ncbi:5-formyltetrahydrofolate cyclo-ligase [Desulfoplanes formicivorans]|uniref:5-formyltetrahydrofolate cyclo-ligase n=1 Tax=Desulfoplanes formicivorans TaxID=1592317 RepID=A0A194ADQ5_9BACT|nr:5-formyltetrahydrofolate cyclo-ligase [Desulfoplanes formicivorans]GAU08207.1 5-formyltetrahydrofolate cyclo-ligase [Desulfoplanes formicivorans]